MPKGSILRVRVSPIFRERLARYIENENRRGRNIDESTVVRDAVVEYLDREEQRPELFRHGSGHANDLPPAPPNPRLVTPEQKEVLGKAVKATESETTNSPTEHGAEFHLRDRQGEHAKKAHPPK